MARFLILLISLLCAFSLFAQNNEEKLLHLKKKLPGLSSADSLRNYINISSIYIHSLPVRSDSAVKFAQRAYQLAIQLKDKKQQGIVAALHAEALLQQGVPDPGYRFYRIARDIGFQLNDSNLQATGIRGMAQALWYKGFYNQAINTMIISIGYFRQLGRWKDISDAYVIISSIYGDQGNYEKAFEAAQQALQLSWQYNDRDNIILSLVQIGKLYRAIGDYSTAMEYYKRGYNQRPVIGEWTYRHLAHCMGDVYFDQHRYDSALYYYRQSFSGNPQSRFSKLKMGQFYFTLSRYDSAFAYFHDLYTSIDKSGEGHIMYDAMLGLGHIYLYKKNITRAAWFASEVLKMARKRQARANIKDACYLLSIIYTEKSQPASALTYYKEYVQLKDSIFSDQLKGRLFEFRRIREDEKKLAQIEILKKEKQLTEQKLNNNRILRNLLLAGLLILALLSGIVVWIIMLKRKNENLRNESSRMEWEHLATDLEMQALRAQMNPHFIFNCLSSINRFILKNESDQASDYLTRFSRLIRMVLINSQKSMISLQEEINMLRLYLEMEQLRFKNHFTYQIEFANDIKPAHTMLPPLLLQPFCENAIWHGLMHKKGQGQLSISFTLVGEVLQCTITDNGIGRAKAEEIKKHVGEEYKSLGLKLTSERLALFNEENGTGLSWNMEDVKDAHGDTAGTSVILKIRHRELIEENN